MEICEYGCGKEAIYQFKNKKWCCSKNVSKCSGTINKLKNRKVSDETRKKQSASLKGKLPWNKGKELSESHKLKIGLGNKGKTVSKESKKKMSESMKGKQNRLGFELSQATKNKISNSNKGKIPWNLGKSHSYETRKKIGSKSKNRFCSDDTREKMRLSKLGEKNHMFGRKLSNDQKLKLLESNQYSIRDIEKKFPLFSKIEEMRYNPNNLLENEIQVHCKNHKCQNSKEQGGWFTPMRWQITHRIHNIEKGLVNDGLYFYCSNECKYECPLYHSKINTKNNKPYTQEEYQTFRQQVLKREDEICEYCGEKATHVHHSRPQKLEPGFVLDPDFGIACCQKCHYKYGHKTGTECSTGNLANIVCST